MFCPGPGHGAKSDFLLSLSMVNTQLGASLSLYLHHLSVYFLCQFAEISQNQVWVGQDLESPPVPALPWQDHLPLSQGAPSLSSLASDTPGIQGQAQLLWQQSCHRADH